MPRKLDGTFIESGTITVTQLSGNVNETSNAAYNQANNAYAQANAARSDANTTFATVNTSLGTINTTFGTVNTAITNAHDQANNARSQANTAYGQANAAYGAANTKLSTSGGSISGDLAITGNLTVTGNATTINVSNLSVNDSMILLSTNAVGDSNDIGFIGHFDRGATATHAGLIRKATENRFYLFDNYEVEPTNNVINVAGNNFRVGNLRLGIINANSFVTSAGLDVTGQANAAYGQANASGNFALSAYGQANAAYGAANNRVLKSGDTITGQITGGLSGGGQALDLASNNNYASFRVFRNATASGDGMFIGYGNGNSGATRVYGAGSTSGHSYIDASGNWFRSDAVQYVLNSGNWNINVAGIYTTQPTIGYSISGQTIIYTNQGGPQVLSQGGGAAMMTFHRPGAFAANFGLDSDNQFGLGGWSYGGALGSLKVGSFGVGTTASGTSGEIRATNNITAYYSDIRLKKINGKIDNAIDKLMQLNGYYYVENEIAKSYGYNNKEEQVGVSAQEVEEVLPHVVTPAPFDIAKNEDGTEYSKSGQNYKTVRYERLVPLLIEAIKELKAEIDELKKNN